MNGVWTDEGDVYILDEKQTAKHFIDKKIKELDSMVMKSQDLSFGLKLTVLKCVHCFIDLGQWTAFPCGEFRHSDPYAPEVALSLASSQAFLCCQVQQHGNSPEDTECSGSGIWLC